MRELIIVYDGACPVCSNYVRFIRLRETVGRVVLLDARDGGTVVEGLIARGIDLDEGMVLMMDGQVYHGADCVNRLALLSTPSGLFNRLNAWIFRSAAVSRALYPIMRAGRNLLLKLLNKKNLAQSGFYDA